MSIRFYWGITRWRNYFWFTPTLACGLFENMDNQILVGFMCFSIHVVFGPVIGKELIDVGKRVKFKYEVKGV